jgi:transcriptional regulator with XRE-family HTH domain
MDPTQHMDAQQQWEAHVNAFGAFIREQRKLANLSLRQLADMSQISNPYLSQLERGMHEPSVRVIRSIAKGLNLSAESLLEQAGLLDDDAKASPATETVDAEVGIKADPHLTEEQKSALLAVYRSYRAANEREDREQRQRRSPERSGRS